MGWRRSFEPIERLGHRTFLVRACERFAKRLSLFRAYGFRGSRNEERRSAS